MDMMTERGTLPFGIVKDGVRHRDFELRPRLVKDTMEVAREQGMEKLKDDVFFSLCMTSKQILYIGDISPVPIDMVLEMLDEDMAAITKAKEDLAARLKLFRDSLGSGEAEGTSTVTTSASTPGEKADPGAHEAALSGG